MYVALGMLARVVSHCIRHLPVRSLNIKKFSECVAGFIAARAKLKQETLPPCVGSHFALPSKALFVCLFHLEIFLSKHAKINCILACLDAFYCQTCIVDG